MTKSYTPIHRRILRKVRRIAENGNGHRLARFRIVKGSDDSQLGREWHTYCRYCGKCICVYPQFAMPHRDHAFVSISQCGHPERRTTFLVHA